MKLSKDKVSKKREKLLNQAECKAVIMTAEGNLKLKRIGGDILLPVFGLFYKGTFYFKSPKLRFNSGSNDTSGEQIVAVYTETKGLIFEDDDRSCFVDGSKPVTSDEKFFLIYLTQSFSEAICINGAFGNGLVRIVKDASENEDMLQILRMMLSSYSAKISEDFEQKLQEIGGAVNG